MARHNVYLPDDTVELIEELGLLRDGWSRLLQDSLQLRIAAVGETKIRRAVGRIARRQARERVEQLVPASDG